MKKLHQMVLFSYLGPLVMTFFIAVFILLMQFLWLYVDDFIGKGLSLGLLMELMFYTSWTLVPLALPISVLLSSLMTMGNLGEHYELVAAKTSGISLWKLMRPLIFTAIVLCIVAFLFSNYMYPIANLKHQSLLFDVRKKKMAFNLEEGSFYHDIDDYVIRIDSKGLDNTTIYGVMIYDHTDHNGLTKVTVADWGTIAMSPDEKDVIFILYDGCNYEESTNSDEYKSTRPMQRMFFKKQMMRFSLEGFGMDRTNEDLFKSNYSMQNINQLHYSIDSLEKFITKKNDEIYTTFKKKYTVFLQQDSCRKEPVSENVLSKTIPPRFSKSRKITIEDSSKIVLETTKDEDFFDINPTSSFLEHFTNQKRKRIVDNAINLARNNKQSAEFYNLDIKNHTSTILKHKVALHEKFTLSFACLVLFFIGAPLGAIIRKGGLGISIIISTVLFIIYYVLDMIGKEYALAAEMPLEIGMWLSSFLFLPLGVFLTIKATNDSPLFDMESWGRAIRCFSKKKRKKS